MATVVLERLSTEVCVIRMNRPESLNALNAEMVDELTEVLDEVETLRGCRVVILTGTGRGFCAGFDLNGYGDADAVEREGFILRTFARQREIAGIYTKMIRLRQPIIAAVNGPAAGGGLALVCASDVRLAAESSFYAVSFIRAGYSGCDMGVSWLLPRLVGLGRAHELMLTGRRFTADEAVRYGLVLDVVKDEDLLAAAVEKAEEILVNPPASVELTKSGMWAGAESPSLGWTIEFESRQQMITAVTEDAGEAQRAFHEKRRPEYRWR